MPEPGSDPLIESRPPLPEGLPERLSYTLDRIGAPGPELDPLFKSRPPWPDEVKGLLIAVGIAFAVMTLIGVLT